YHYVVQLVVPGERADPAAPEERLEGGRDIAHGNAEVLRAVAVEGDAQLGLVETQIGVQVRETLDAARPRYERVHGLRQPPEVRILHHELHRLAEPQCPGAVRERLDAGDPEELGEQGAHELLDAAVTSAQVLQDAAGQRPVDASRRAHD